MAAIADEQRRADAGLERLDLLRQRRRGDVQPLCRPAEVKLLGDRDEIAEQPQLHAPNDTPGVSRRLTSVSQPVVAECARRLHALPHGVGSRPLRPEHTEAADGRSVRALALAAISAGFLMITLDATIVNVALRAIGADLGGAPSSAQWVVDGYTVAFASLLLLAGSLADRSGARTGFLVGLTVFVLASAACAVAGSVTFLVAARVAQGVGAAWLMPSSLALITHTLRASPRRVAGRLPSGGPCRESVSPAAPSSEGSSWRQSAGGRSSS